MANHNTLHCYSANSKLHHAAAGPGVSRPQTTPSKLQWGVVKESLTVFVVSGLHRAAVELWAQSSAMPLKTRVWSAEADHRLLLPSSSSPALSRSLQLWLFLLWNSLAHIQTKPCRVPLRARRTQPLCVSHIFYMLWTVVAPHRCSWASDRLCIPYIFSQFVASWVGCSFIRPRKSLDSALGAFFEEEEKAPKKAIKII